MATDQPCLPGPRGCPLPGHQGWLCRLLQQQQGLQTAAWSAWSADPSPACRPGGSAQLVAGAAALCVETLERQRAMMCCPPTPPPHPPTHPPDSHPPMPAGAASAAVDVDALCLPVRFTVRKHCSFGDAMAVCGAHPALGDWDPTSSLQLEVRAGGPAALCPCGGAAKPADATPRLQSPRDGCAARCAARGASAQPDPPPPRPANCTQWSEGDVWTGLAHLPVDQQIDFKYICKSRNGGVKYVRPLGAVPPAGLASPCRPPPFALHRCTCLRVPQPAGAPGTLMQLSAHPPPASAHPFVPLLCSGAAAPPATTTTPAWSSARRGRGSGL
jgi:hypothetical protein